MRVKELLEKFDELLENTIIDGGYDYDKEDSWISEDEAKKRLRNFVVDLLL